MDNGNTFLQMDDMMDGDDLGLLDNSYNPFLTNLSNMSLAQSHGMHMRPGMHHAAMRQGQVSPAHLDVDMMAAGNPQGNVGANNNNSTLFQAYASQFGMKPATHMPDPAADANSVEAYAAMMGVKLESPRSAMQPKPTFDARAQNNAAYFESLLKMQAGPGMGGNNAHNLTSMTLPAGVGAGFQMNPHVAPGHNGNNNMNNVAMPLDARAAGLVTMDGQAPGPIKAEKPMPVQFSSGLVGSQTLSPEMLSSMIQSNMQSGDVTSHSYGSNTWNASDFDYEKDALISKADKSRERNRDHSRKSRLRKKVFVETLKQEVKQLQIYKDLVDQNPDLIALVTADHDRKMLYATASFSRVLGYPEKKLMADTVSFFELVHPDHVAMLKAELSKLAKFQDINSIPFQIKHAKGMYWKAALSARVGEHGVVFTSRVEKENLPAASMDRTL
ncbi:hypothetical protein SDRG_02707 [Saprolegnia diclina VS20]|uniref:PAS domain-containing protein n=1 Tax=Saprolegnia diclina (strain VS20) TaxID=1156394 RepID=T0SBD6_SAPDV|nr:hypothetical protein SDRG_02707 [Saprolegnia diclina VS20]EQC40052.1 hypothetical protein SDRG_02707 [Saprolegnia diclina VS20]|eukprot:XP_008606526.1 hypothetical protein SDRG_02707 [Saprolegnia diclina VS20]